MNVYWKVLIVLVIGVMITACGPASTPPPEPELETTVLFVQPESELNCPDGAKPSEEYDFVPLEGNQLVFQMVLDESGLGYSSWQEATERFRGEFEGYNVAEKRIESFYPGWETKVYLLNATCNCKSENGNIVVIGETVPVCGGDEVPAGEEVNKVSMNNQGTYDLGEKRITKTGEFCWGGLGVWVEPDGARTIVYPKGEHPQGDASYWVYMDP